MKDLLNRLQRTKMILASMSLTVAGTLLLIIGRTTSGDSASSGSFVLIPWGEFGEILIGAGLLSIWIDHLFKREQRATNEHQLRAIMHDHAPAMRDSVLHAFAADEADLARVATPETLDQIITNSLGLRLHDKGFASEIFADLKKQAIDIEERWYDASVFINITPHETAEGYFTVTSRWEYTTTPKHHERRFIRVSNRRDYVDIARSGGNTSAWYSRPDEQFTAGDKRAFSLLNFTVDGEDRTIRRSSRKDYQQYTAFVGTEVIEAAKPVTITYTARTVTKASGHVLFFGIEQPTKDMQISFDYTGTDIATVSAIDLVQSTRPTRIEHSPEGAPSKTLRVDVDGWVFPRSGVAFVWTLASEVGQSAWECQPVLAPL